MRKKLSITLVLSTLLIAFTLIYAINQKSVQASSYKPQVENNDFNFVTYNQEKLTNYLTEEGILPNNATPEETQTIINQYLQAKENSFMQNNDDNILNATFPHNRFANIIQNGRNMHHRTNFVPQTWHGEVRTDRILVLLIDYPDLPHGSIQPEETDMYYDDYTHQHYQDMIFGENGYTGPNGENLISMKQYYEEQSGGSYTIEGNVAGWYTAEHEAAYYGANDPQPDGSDIRPRELIYEGLTDAAKDPNINLADYDIEDPYDLDNDGDLREPDGIIDHLMIVHAGVGEEAGGGYLGGDAIWSHSWSLWGGMEIPGTTTDVPYWGGSILGYKYTIMPEDGAAGVFCHEYGHNLGLPDEYDTQYSGAGEPVSSWSVMAHGSWAGTIPGTEPTGFSPYDKQFLQQEMPNSNWQHQLQISLSDVKRRGLNVALDQASIKGYHNDVVRIDLPVNKPAQGRYEFASGHGENLNNSMYTTVDLTYAYNANLTFKTWYQIEDGWDYASVYVITPDGEYHTVQGNITTTEDPYGQNPGNGITGDSNGWVNAIFDLSEFKGQKITIGFNYWTDGAYNLAGFYVDDIKIKANFRTLVRETGESCFSRFTMDGFNKVKEGTFNYYLVEYRSNNGADKGLANVYYGGYNIPFDPGMVVWYVNESYNENWTGIHPGEAYLGVVDADQNYNYLYNSDHTERYTYATILQIHDAAFSRYDGNEMYFSYYGLYSAYDDQVAANPTFDDSNDYSNSPRPDSGLILPQYGLKITVMYEQHDRSGAFIHISK